MKGSSVPKWPTISCAAVVVVIPRSSHPGRRSLGRGSQLWLCSDPGMRRPDSVASVRPFNRQTCRVSRKVQARVEHAFLIDFCADSFPGFHTTYKIFHSVLTMIAAARGQMIARHLGSKLAGPSSQRAFSTSPVVAREIQNVTVFGAGLMGAGIAQVLAHKGKYNVTLTDVTDKAVANGQKIISKSLARIAKKSLADKSAEEQASFVQGVVDSIKTTTDAGEAVAQSDLVIEAIIENVGIKQELFKFLDSKAPQEAIFASNTSSLSIADIAKSTQRLDRFGGEYCLTMESIRRLWLTCFTFLSQVSMLSILFRK